MKIKNKGEKKLHRFEILFDQSLATEVLPSEILSPCHFLPVWSSTLNSPHPSFINSKSL